MTVDIAGLARSSFKHYCIAMREDFEVAEHHRLIASALQRVTDGKLKRLIITMPPRHGKSLETTQLFPSYFLGRHPNKSIITATYAQDLSDDMGRAVKGFMDSPQYAELFPDSVVNRNSDSIRRFHTIKGGAYFSAGVMGPVTGRGAHVLIIDDPYKNRQEADSPVIREGVWKWYTSTARTRLAKRTLGWGKGAIIIIHTRWHEDDLAGKLLAEQGEEWEVLNLPAIAIAGEVCPMGRKPGEALWPDAFPAEDLLEIARDLGPRDWAALYQQDPTPEGGNIIRAEWIEDNLYDELPDKVDEWMQSWDTSFKGKDGSDYVVGQVWARKGKQGYLDHQIRGRFTFTQTIEMMKSVSELYPQATNILVEDKANGSAILDTLPTHLPHHKITPFEPGSNSKEGRYHAVSPQFANGNIHVKRSAAWLPGYIKELSKVPSAKNDDQADATAQAILQFNLPGAGAIIDFYAKKAELLLAKRNAG